MVDQCQFSNVTVAGSILTESHGWYSKCQCIDLVSLMECVELLTGKIKLFKTVKNVNLNNWVIIYVTLRVAPNTTYKVSSKRFLMFKNVKSHWDTAEYRSLYVSRHFMSLKIGNTSQESIKSLHSITFWKRIITSLGIDKIEYLKLSDIHTIFNVLTPIEMCSIRVSSALNCEILTRKYVSLSKFLPAIQNLHKECNEGRTYIRQFGEVTSIDVHFQKKEHFEQYFKVLFNIGVRKIDLHLGKWVPDCVSPLSKNSTLDLWSRKKNFKCRILIQCGCLPY